ncbi:MAG: hypothetical protein M1118_14080 [Chloroflexi bacterium]|nr:hypothetical protein [Chloroflexota bacterium]
MNDASAGSTKHVLARYVAWLETMRGTQGYGGPVAHWWGQCLRFTGAGIDWRYEGIILGYLRLWERSRQSHWLDLACVAADDIVASQLPSGAFRNSSFELNPLPFGTPHEAACDLALLRLALTLREYGLLSDCSARYAEVAQRNLKAVFCSRLWDPETGAFRDVPAVQGFVPNKQATAAEAFLALSEWTGDRSYANTFALPALALVLRSQEISGPAAGGLDQILVSSRDGMRASGRHFPLYVARCLPGLILGARIFGRADFADCAMRAAQFIRHQVSPEGQLPLIVYTSGKRREFPHWCAGLGDVCRGLRSVDSRALDDTCLALERTLLLGQDGNGAFHTASGFAAILGDRWSGEHPELRDILHVTGWTDKAFRYLAETLPLPEGSPVEVPDWQTTCVFRERRLRLIETADELVVEQRGRRLYRWKKGTSWAEVIDPILDIR